MPDALDDALRILTQPLTSDPGQLAAEEQALGAVERRQPQTTEPQPIAPQEPFAPTRLSEYVGAGASAATHGMVGSIHAVRAMLSRRPENVAEALKDMAYREELAAQASYGVQPFGEFVDDVTNDLNLSGMPEQVAFAVGQVLPSLALSFAGGGVGGAAAMAVGRAAATSAARNAAAKWATDFGRDITTRRAKRAVQNDFSNVIMKAARKEALTDDEVKKYGYITRANAQLEGRGLAKRGQTGALIGALGTEYPFAFGESGKELLDPEVLAREGFPTGGEILGAAAVGGLSASLNVAAEAASIYRLVKKTGVLSAADDIKGLDVVATFKERGVLGTGMAGLAGAAGVAGRMAGRMGRKGAEVGAIEGITEASQESLQMAFRSLTDDEYEFSQDLMRVGQAAFTGAFGAGTIGAAGAAVTVPIGTATQAVTPSTTTEQPIAGLLTGGWVQVDDITAQTIDPSNFRSSFKVGGEAVGGMAGNENLNKEQRDAFTAAWKAGGEHIFDVGGVGSFIVKNLGDAGNPDLYVRKIDDAAGKARDGFAKAREAVRDWWKTASDSYKEGVRQAHARGGTTGSFRDAAKKAWEEAQRWQEEKLAEDPNYDPDFSYSELWQEIREHLGVILDDSKVVKGAKDIWESSSYTFKRGYREAQEKHGGASFRDKFEQGWQMGAKMADGDPAAPEFAESWEDFKAQMSQTLDRSSLRHAVRIAGDAVRKVSKYVVLDKDQRTAIYNAWKGGGKQKFDVDGVGRFVVQNAGDEANPDLYVTPSDETWRELHPDKPDAMKDIRTAIDENGIPSKEQAELLLGRYPAGHIPDDVDKSRVVVTDANGVVVRDELVPTELVTDAKEMAAQESSPTQSVHVLPEDGGDIEAQRLLRAEQEPLITDVENFIDRPAPKHSDDVWRRFERNAALASQLPAPILSETEKEQFLPELPAPVDAPLEVSLDSLLESVVPRRVRTVRDMTRMKPQPQPAVEMPIEQESWSKSRAGIDLVKQATAWALPNLSRRLARYGDDTVRTEQPTIYEPDRTPVPDVSQLQAELLATVGTPVANWQPPPSELPGVETDTPPVPGEPQPTRPVPTLDQMMAQVGLMSSRPQQQPQEPQQDPGYEAFDVETLEMWREVMGLAMDRSLARQPWRVPVMADMDVTGRTPLESLKTRKEGRLRRLGKDVEQALGAMPNEQAERMRDMLLVGKSTVARTLRKEVDLARVRGAIDGTGIDLIKTALLLADERKAKLDYVFGRAEEGAYGDPDAFSDQFKEAMRKWRNAETEPDVDVARQTLGLIARSEQVGKGSELWALELLASQFYDLISTQEMQNKRADRVRLLEGQLRDAPDKDSVAQALAAEVLAQRFDDTLLNSNPLDIFLEPELVRVGVRRLLAVTTTTQNTQTALNLRAMGEQAVLESLDKIINNVMVGEVSLDGLIRSKETSQGSPVTPSQRNELTRWQFAVQQTGNMRPSEGFYVASIHNLERQIEETAAAQLDIDKPPAEWDEDNTTPDEYEGAEFVGDEWTVGSVSMRDQLISNENGDNSVRYGPKQVVENGGWVVPSQEYRGRQNWKTDKLDNAALQDRWDELLGEMEPEEAAKFGAYEHLIGGSTVANLTDRGGEFWLDRKLSNFSIVESKNAAGRDVVSVSRDMPFTGGGAEAYVANRVRTAERKLIQGAKPAGTLTEVDGKWRLHTGEDENGEPVYLSDRGGKPIEADTRTAASEVLYGKTKGTKGGFYTRTSPVSITRQTLLDSDTEVVAWEAAPLNQQGDVRLAMPHWGISEIVDMGRAVNSETDSFLQGPGGNKLNQGKQGLLTGYGELKLKGWLIETDGSDFLENATEMVRVESSGTEQQLAAIREQLPETAAAMGMRIGNADSKLTLRDLLVVPNPVPASSGLGWSEIVKARFEPHLAYRKRLLTEDPELYKKAKGSLDKMIQGFLSKRTKDRAGVGRVSSSEMPPPSIAVLVEHSELRQDVEGFGKALPKKERDAVRKLYHGWSSGVVHAMRAYDRDLGLNAVSAASRFNDATDIGLGQQGGEADPMVMAESRYRTQFKDYANVVREYEHAQSEYMSLVLNEPYAELQAGDREKIADRLAEQGSAAASRLQFALQMSVERDYKTWAGRLKLAIKRLEKAQQAVYLYSESDLQHDATKDLVGVRDKIEVGAAVNSEFKRHYERHGGEPRQFRAISSTEAKRAALAGDAVVEGTTKRLPPLTPENVQPFATPTPMANMPATMQEMVGSLVNAADVRKEDLGTRLLRHDAAAIAEIESITTVDGIMEADIGAEGMAEIVYRKAVDLVVVPSPRPKATEHRADTIIKRVAAEAGDIPLPQIGFGLDRQQVQQLGTRRLTLGTVPIPESRFVGKPAAQPERGPKVFGIERSQQALRELDTKLDEWEKTRVEVKKAERPLAFIQEHTPKTPDTPAKRDAPRKRRRSKSIGVPVQPRDAEGNPTSGKPTNIFETNKILRGIQPMIDAILPNGAPPVYVVRGEDLLATEPKALPFGADVISKAKRRYIAETANRADVTGDADAVPDAQGFAIFDKVTGGAVIVSNIKRPVGLRHKETSQLRREAEFEWESMQQHEALTVAHEVGHVWLRWNQRRFFTEGDVSKPVQPDTVDGWFEQRKAALEQITPGRKPRGTEPVPESAAEYGLTEEGRVIWDAYMEHRDQVVSDMVRNQDYTADVQGFDEFMADQVARYVVEGESAFDKIREFGKAKQYPKSTINKLLQRLREIAQTMFKFLEDVGKKIYGNRFAKNVVAQESIKRIVAESNTRSVKDRWDPDEPLSTNVLGDIAALQVDVSKITTLAKQAKIMDRAKKFVKNNSTSGWMSAFVPTVSQLRAMGTAGRRLANFFERPSRGVVSQEGYISLHQAISRQEFIAFAESVGLDPFGPESQWDDPNIRSALNEAAMAGDHNEPLRPLAQKIVDYFRTSNEKYNVTDTPRRRYFPRQINFQMLETQTGRRNMASLLVRRAKVDQAEANRIVSQMIDDRVDREDSEAGTEGPVRGEGYTPGVSAQMQRVLEAIPTGELLANGLAHPPREAAIGYINSVSKRTAFDRLGGDEKLQELIAAVVADGDPDQMAERAMRTEKLVRGMMGQHGVRMSPMARSFADIARNISIWTLLPMALLSQVPEIGYVLTRAQGVVSFAESIRILMGKISYKDRTELAHALGVVGPPAQEAMLATVGSLDYQSARSRKANEWFFRVTGLQMFTTFIKGLASGMGQQFLMNAAADPTPRNLRFLRQLGVTVDDVSDWQNDNFNLEGRPKIEQALRSFVREATVAPNTAIRPGLGNDPRWAFIYTLKSFLYGAGVQIIAGMGREFSTRWYGGQRKDAIMFATYAAATTLPLAIVALEVREFAKFGLRTSGQFVGLDVPDPGAAFLSDSMGGLAYLNDILGRTGLLGPATIATSAVQAMGYDQNILTATVPIFDFAAEVVTDPVSVAPLIRTI